MLTEAVVKCSVKSVLVKISQKFKAKQLLSTSNQSFSRRTAKCALHKGCPYSEFFRSLFSRIRSEYGDLRSKSPCPVQMRENASQKNSEYGKFSQSGDISPNALSLPNCLWYFIKSLVTNIC